MKYKMLVNVNDDYKTAIFRIPKVANSSFKKLFPIFANGRGMKDLGEIKDILGEKYEQYFKFPDSIG